MTSFARCKSLFHVSETAISSAVLTRDNSYECKTNPFYSCHRNPPPGDPGHSMLSQRGAHGSYYPRRMGFRPSSGDSPIIEFSKFRYEIFFVSVLGPAAVPVTVEETVPVTAELNRGAPSSRPEAIPSTPFPCLARDSSPRPSTTGDRGEDPGPGGWGPGDPGARGGRGPGPPRPRGLRPPGPLADCQNPWGHPPSSR